MQNGELEITIFRISKYEIIIILFYRQCLHYQKHRTESYIYLNIYYVNDVFI